MSRNIKVYIYPFQLKKTDVLTDGPAYVGGPTFKIDSNTMLIWVDLLPEARFTHPTAYVLISGSNVRVEKGGWWPILNGQQILYGQNPIVVPSPFDVSTDAPDPDKLLSLLGDGTLPFGNGHLPDGNGLLPDYLAASAARRVFTVDAVDLAVIKTLPPKLMISCLGTTRTSGWNNPRLVPRSYIQPPPDGIWEFDIVADPPTGIVLQVVTPVTASYLYEGNFSTWRGVRVVAETNKKEKFFGDTKAVSDTGHVIIEPAR